MITTRKLLKFYSKDKDGRVKLRKLFKMALDEGFITEQEYWLLIYAYAERRMVENTCAKLGMCKVTYASRLNIALLKMDYIIKKIK